MGEEHTLADGEVETKPDEVIGHRKPLVLFKVRLDTGQTATKVD